jgi:hypothetical protein
MACGIIRGDIVGIGTGPSSSARLGSGKRR